MLELLATALLGGGVVCAEARGVDNPWEEQTAIAAVVAERVVRTGAPPLRVLTAPYQFAKPCGPSVMRARHVAAFLAGYTGVSRPAWWREGVVGFDNVRRGPRRGRCGRLAQRWRRRGWREVRAPGMAHRFWRGRK